MLNFQRSKCVYIKDYFDSGGILIQKDVYSWRGSKGFVFNPFCRLKML